MFKASKNLSKSYLSIPESRKAQMTKSKGLLLSRPKDESLEAYQAWIMEMFYHLTGKTEDNSTTE